MSRLLAACEAMPGTIDTRIDSRHHEATVGAQTAFFFENVNAMTTVLQDMGNPFQDESSELLSLGTKNIADPSLAQLVATHHQIGLQQFQLFLGGLHNEECSFYNPIKKNKVAFFKQEQRVCSSKENTLKETASYYPDCSSPARQDNVICRNYSDMRTCHHLPPSVIGVNFIMSEITAHRDS